LDNVLSFSVDRIELLEEISNSQFAKARVWAFASGENKHEMTISEESLIRAENTIYDKPLVWLYSKLLDDATGHSTLEVPAGFVPKHSANISYERAEDGRLFFVVDALIWKYYSGKLLEIFQKTDGKKSVSVEIVLVETKELENGKVEIVDFVYRAITVLGEAYSPAIPLANAQIIQFSQDKFEVEKILEFSRIELNKECDQVDFNYEEFAQSFSMSANELWKMLYSACREAKYQEDGDDYQYIRYYMRDHDADYIYAYDYKEDKTVAIPYSISNGEASCDFENVKPAKQKWVVTESNEGNEGMVEFAKEILSKEFADLESQIASFQEKINTLEKEKSELSAQFSTEKEELVSKISILETEIGTEKSDLLTKFSEIEKEKSSLKEKISELENKKIEFAEKIKSLESENVELKTFKANVEEQERKTKIDFAINSVSDDLTQDQIDEWRGKVDEFENIEAFSNAIKAFAYSLTKNQKDKDDITIASMALDNKNNSKTKGLWD